MSNSSAALVGAAGMKARKRGLSQEITAGARTSLKTVNTSAGSRPPAVINPSKAASRVVLSPTRSSGTGSISSRQRHWSRMSEVSFSS